MCSPCGCQARLGKGLGRLAVTVWVSGECISQCNSFDNSREEETDDTSTPLSALELLHSLTGPWSESQAAGDACPGESARSGGSLWASAPLLLP